MKKLIGLAVLILAFIIAPKIAAEDQSELWQADEAINLTDKVTLEPDSLFYGKETEEGIAVQFGDKKVTIDSDVASLAEVTEKSEYVELDNGNETTISGEFEHEDGLITVEKEITYPVTENGGVIVGNIKFESVSKSNDEDSENAQKGDEENSSTEQEQKNNVTDSEEDKENPENDSTDQEQTDSTDQEENNESQQKDSTEEDQSEENQSSDETNDSETTDGSEGEKESSKEEASGGDQSEDRLSTQSTQPMPTNEDDYFEITQEQITVYDNRSGSLEPVAHLQAGEAYPIDRVVGNWVRIQFGDYSGYVYKEATTPHSGSGVTNLDTDNLSQSRTITLNQNAAVYDNSQGGLEEFARIHDGTKLKAVKKMGNWWQVVISDRVGYIYHTAVEAGFNSSDQYFKVLQDNVTIYQRGNDGLKSVGKLKEGQTYERLSGSGNWHTVQFGSEKAYIYMPATAPVTNHNSNANQPSDGRAIQANQDITVYDNSTGELVPYARLYEGTELKIMRDYGNWWQVDISGQIGYVWKGGTTMDFHTSDAYYKTSMRTSIYERQDGDLVKVGQLHKGETFERIRDYGNWHEIQYANKRAYVYKPATEPAISRDYDNPIRNEFNIGQLTTNQTVEVYDNTGDGLDAFATLDSGTDYHVVGDLGGWYEVNVSGRYGYVSASKVDAEIMHAKDVVKPYQEYSYSQMQADIDEIDENYGSLVTVDSIGQSVHGRDLPVVKVGNGDTKVLINASHHAREWITTNLVMEQVDQYTQAYARDEQFDGYDVRNLLDRVTIYYVPMVNPDGVKLVQDGPNGFSNRSELIQMNDGSTNFSSWKANGRGVDLNRQYPADWDDIRNVEPSPGPERYKGPHPLSEPETKALSDFTNAHNFKSSIAYHSSGEILYWDYYTSGQLREDARNLADQISYKTSYGLVMTDNPSGGGYKDWVLDSLHYPSYTPEVSPYVGARPVPLDNFSRIWSQNDSIGLLLAEEALTR